MQRIQPKMPVLLGVYSHRAALLLSRNGDFLKVDAASFFPAQLELLKNLCVGLGSSLRLRFYRAGSDWDWSGSVIGASLAASLAPMTRSGGVGRWRHRAQACFLLVLL
jgi:hypothetical protein